MKKLIGLAAVLLVLMLGAAALTDWGLPGKGVVPGPAGGEGIVKVAENRWLTSRIYTLTEGEITGIYQEYRLHSGEERRIVRVAMAEETVYFLRAVGQARDWELVSLVNGKAVTLCRGTLNVPGELTGLVVRDDTFWITEVGENQGVYVYRFNAEDGVLLEMILPPWWLRGIVSAEFDGDAARISSSYGDHGYMTSGGKITYDKNAAETPLPELRTDQAGPWFLCKGTPLLTALLLWLFVTGTALGAFLAGRKALRLADRLTAAGGEVLLLALAGTVVYLFCTASTSVSLTAADRAAKTAALAALGIWIAGVAVLRFTAVAITRPIRVLTRQMERVAEGDVRSKDVSPGRDELCCMDRSLQEMCMSLAIRNYEIQCIIRSYSRFVPQKLAELLDRAAVEEVDPGDNRRIMGNVGLFSIGNRGDARGVLGDADFVSFLSGSFGMFYDCVTAKGGCVLSGGLRLESMEALFSGAAADGVFAGLDLLGEAMAAPKGGVPAPHPVLMLHRGPFLYGVAGRDERLFPYISSAELEFLGSLSQQFYQVGVRIVATEEYWKQLEGFSGRYIGFVSDGEHGGAYKLYEILDAYPELERTLRQSYDNRFQEALNLFYHKDFYLARNIFSNLLRVCPEDGVARWYLFACERFFHQEGGAEPDCQLFAPEG